MGDDEFWDEETIQNLADSEEDGAWRDTLNDIAGDVRAVRESMLACIGEREVEITRLRAQRRKMQRAARKALVHFDRNYETGEGSYFWWRTEDTLTACQRCYRVAHNGECR